MTEKNHPVGNWFNGSLTKCKRRKKNHNTRLSCHHLTMNDLFLSVALKYMTSGVGWGKGGDKEINCIVLSTYT